MKTIQKKKVDLDEVRLDLLIAGGIEDWPIYEGLMVVLDETGQVYKAWQVLEALDTEDVMNWEGYEEAMEFYEDYCDYLKAFEPDAEVKTFKTYKGDKETELAEAEERE